MEREMGNRIWGDYKGLFFWKEAAANVDDESRIHLQNTRYCIYKSNARTIYPKSQGNDFILIHHQSPIKKTKPIAPYLFVVSKTPIQSKQHLPSLLFNQSNPTLTDSNNPRLSIYPFSEDKDPSYPQISSPPPIESSQISTATCSWTFLILDPPPP